MDQVKIGKFIAERRKAQGLTQAALAEKLGITDRAISKWETGRAMPDSSIMLELCEILEINVTELLTGELIMKNEYDKKLEQSLIDMVKQKEEADKRLLRMEIIIGVPLCIVYLVLLFVASLVDMQDWLRILLICVGFIPFLTYGFYAIRIEQVAGYYECKECGHKYVPTYMSVFFAMHVNRTRYMKCPHCGKKSWQHKVISKD